MLAVILALSALFLILLAIFSKRIKDVSNKIEAYKGEKDPSYAKRRDVFKCYCPNCNNQLPKEAVSNYRWLKLKAMTVCGNCDSKLRVSLLPSLLYLCAIILFVAVDIARRKYVFPYVLYLAAMLLSIGLVISSLMVEKYRVSRKD